LIEERAGEKGVKDGGALGVPGSSCAWRKQEKPEG